MNKKIILLFIVLSFFLYFFKMHTGNTVFLAGYFLSVVGLFLLLFPLAKTRKNYLLLLFSIIFMMIFFSFFSRSYPLGSVLLGGAYLVSSAIIAWGICYCEKDKLLSDILFYSFFLFMLPKFFSIGFNFDEYNYILYEASRNILGSFFIILSTFHVLVCKRNKIPFPLLVPFLSFISCVLLYGRSSILLSFILLCFGLMVRYKIRMALVICVTTLLGGVYFFVEIYDFIIQKTNFGIGFKTERTVMLEEYFSNMDIYSFFFGQNLQQCCQYIVSFESNPHNSFIMGHARYGISHTIIFLLFSVYIIKQRDLELLLVFLIISARYFVDQIGLFSPLDFVYLYMFYVIASNKEKIERF